MKLHIIRALWPVLAVLAWCLIPAAPGASQSYMERKGEDFSADELHVSGGRQTATKVFMSQGKMRRESHGMVMIARLDKKIAWMIDPSQKSYFETTLDPAKFPMMAQEVEKNVERKELGREKVAGFDCVKYQVTMEVGGPAAGVPPGMAAKMGGPRKMVTTVWLSDKLGAALKSQSEDGFTMEMTNIKVEPQPAALFEPPAGYAKIDLPPMMQQFMGGGGMPPGAGKGQMPPGMGGGKGKARSNVGGQ
jgi:hypothetical protein